MLMLRDAHAAAFPLKEDDMNRRQFAAAGLTAVPLAFSDASSAAAASAAGTLKATTRPPSRLKLGCQSGPSTNAHFAFLARYGVHNCSASPVIADPERLYPTVDELTKLKEMAAANGLSVDLIDSVLLQSSHVDKEKHAAIMLADSPERDRDIETFQTVIRNCAAAGIPAVKYNMSLLGVLRNVRVPGRGDAEYVGWDYSREPTDVGLTRAGPVDADRYWERIQYFLERVVPVAEEYKVRIACHPHDPGLPPAGYQGISAVLGTVDGLKRFVGIKESPYHGLNFCQGTVSEMLADPGAQIFDVIRWFGSRRKIFNIHFRNIRGHRDNFVETFPDEGDVNMLKAALTYREVGYDGMLMPDHVPLLRAPKSPEQRPANDYADNYGRASPRDDGRDPSFAFAYGYIRGVIQAVELFG
jgi:mannonate dehydratase